MTTTVHTDPQRPIPYLPRTGLGRAGLALLCSTFFGAVGYAFFCLYAYVHNHNLKGRVHKEEDLSAEASETAESVSAATTETAESSASDSEVSGSENETGNDCFINACGHMFFAQPELTTAIIATRDENLRELIAYLSQPTRRIRTGASRIRKCLDRIKPAEDRTDYLRGQHDASRIYDMIMSYLVEKHPVRFHEYVCTETETKTIVRSFPVAELFLEPVETEETRAVFTHLPFTVEDEAQELQTYVTHYFNHEIHSEAGDERIDQGIQRTWNRAPRQLAITLTGASDRGRPSVSGVETIELPDGTRYRLTAYTVHLGSDGAGHWTAGRLALNRYFKISDRTAAPCTREDFLVEASLKARRLVYERIDA